MVFLPGFHPGPRVARATGSAHLKTLHTSGHSRGTLSRLIMPGRNSPSDNGGMHASLGLTVGVFSILVGFPAFAQENQPQPAYEPEPPPQGSPQQHPSSGNPPPDYHQAPVSVDVPIYARRLLVMPYIGVATLIGSRSPPPVGGASESYDTGFRMGSLLGWRPSSHFSINGEFTVDFLNPPKGVFLDVTLDLSFSPLFHLSIGKLEIVVGPKVGFSDEIQTWTVNDQSYNSSYSGLMFGANAGVLAKVRSIAIGGLVSYTGRSYTGWCWWTDGESRCRNGPGTLHTVSLGGVVLF